MNIKKKEPNSWATLGCAAGVAFGATYGYLDAASKFQETGILSKTIFAVVTGIAVKHTIDAHRQYTAQYKPKFDFNNYMGGLTSNAFAAAMLLHTMTMGDLSSVAKAPSEAALNFPSVPSPTIRMP